MADTHMVFVGDSVMALQYHNLVYRVTHGHNPPFDLFPYAFAEGRDGENTKHTGFPESCEKQKGKKHRTVLQLLRILKTPKVFLILNAVKKSWIFLFQIEIFKKQKGVKSTCTDLANFRKSQGLHTYFSHLFDFWKFQFENEKSNFLFLPR